MLVIHAAGLGLGVASSGWSQGPPVGFERPNLAALEEAIQDQIRAREVALEEALAQADVPRAQLATTWGALGEIYLLYEFFEAAGACLTNASDLAPREFRWRYHLGDALANDGSLLAAIESFERAAALRPGDLTTKVRLGELYLETGDLAGARSSYEGALEGEWEAAARYGLGQIAVREGRFAEAIPQLQRVLELQPQADRVYFHLGMAYRGLGDMRPAREHLARAGDDNVTFPDPLSRELQALALGGRVHERAGLQAADSGDLIRAVEQFREAVRENPGEPSALHNLGLAEMKLGNREAGEDYLREAIRIDPNYRIAHFNLGVALREKGDLEGAEEHLHRAVEIDPLDTVARMEWAWVLYQLGRPQRAVEELESVLATRPGDEEATDRLVAVLRQLGAELGQQQQFEAAAERFERVIQLRPDTLEAHFGYAMALILAGSDGRARTVLEAGSVRFPNAVPLKHLLARLLAASPQDGVRDGEISLRLAQEVLRANPTLDHAETVAMAFAELGRFDEARRWQQRVLDEARRLEDPFLGIREARMEAYLRGEPIRSPWLGGASS